MYLGAEAEIALDALNARTSGGRVVQVTQVSGESRHEVAQSDNPGSHYGVNTPAGNGSATRATFDLGQPAVSAHMAHGDTLGHCPSEKPDKQSKQDK